MKLVTAITLLKREMNGGRLPPMTPVPDSVLHVVNPAFTIGMGALDEDSERGVRCPVCGKYCMSQLRRHLDCAHKDVGGARAVLRALDIPEDTALCSQAVAARLAEQNAALRATGKLNSSGLVRKRTASNERSRSQKTARSRRSTAFANQRDRCLKQVSHRLIDLQHSLGRVPTSTEAIMSEGAGFVSCCAKLFGSWNSAIATCGLEARVPRHHRRRRAWDQSATLAALSAYYAEHGRLPNRGTADNPRVTPLIPRGEIIIKALGADSWRQAMDYSASILNIYGGRYGLPVKKEAAA